MQAREGFTDFLTAHNLVLSDIRRLEHCGFQHFNLSSTEFLKREMALVLPRR